MHERLGKFQILRPLGRGSMGEVYLAQDTVLGRQVAIKTIQAGSALGGEARARFEREARVTSTLVHPNIVTVYDFGEAEGLFFLAMEFVEGDTFEACMAKGAYSRTDLLEALAQVAEALAFAHEHGIIHRDVKPSNVLIRQRGRRILAKLMDFGVATMDQSNLTQQGIWMGTVNYMAPEYLDTGRATASSDLFAVGVMLFEIVTGGRRPFGGETTTTILNAILRDAPAPLTFAEQKAAGPALLAVLGKALAKRPEDRYDCGEALAEAIRQASTGGTPVQGAPEPIAQMPSPEPVAPIPSPEPVAQVPSSGPERRETPPPQAPPPDAGHTIRLPRDPGSRPLVVGRGAAATVLSLRVALRQAEPGASIRVLPGHYRESLVIDRPVRILAEGAPGEVVLEGSRGATLTLGAPGIHLEGLTLTGQDTGTPVVHVISGEACLKDCRVQGASSSLVCVEGAGTRLTFDQGSVVGAGDVGMTVRQGGALTLSGTGLEGFQRAAVLAEQGAQVRARDVRMGQGIGVGFWGRSGAQLHLQGCVVEGREAGGAEVEDGARLEVQGGTFTGSRMAGVLLNGHCQAMLQEVSLVGHGASGLHVEGEGRAQLRDVSLRENRGFGASLRGGSLSMEGGEVLGNTEAGILIGAQSTAQVKDCRIQDGRHVGLLCLSGGKGALEACEISGNALTGARVEPGGSLLLLRCTLRDGQETGLMVFEDAEATLEQCVVHRNARGGILLAKNAADPTIRDAEGIQDDLYRIGPQGEPIRLAPVRRH